MIFEQVHPGRILKRELEARGLSAAALALKLRIAPQRITRLSPAVGQFRQRPHCVWAATSATNLTSGSPCQ